MLPLLVKEQPENTALSSLNRQIKDLGNVMVGSKLPRFSTKDVNGKAVNDAMYSNKNVAIISVWATWSYESLDIQRALNDAVKAGKIAALSICVDANPKEVRQSLVRDDIQFPNVCDGKMLSSPLLKTFGLTMIPDNIVIRNGKVTERNITANTIRQRYGVE